MNSEDRFAVGSILAGKLRIVRQLGAGGMGAVYEVEHELTRHRRALKLLHAQMAQVPSVVERFLREASAAGRIGNPHIVETFDAGRLESGEPYIVMELLQGKTLAELLEERGPLPLERACEIVIQACDAVSAAHAAGIVHRDIKPENLFLAGTDLSFVKILDFGVSKFDSATTGVDGLTMEGSPIGTPYYMSPEQVRGEKSIDARADVYALGVLFYECLTGAKPFVAETLPHLAVLIHQGKYEAPSHLRRGLPPAADTVISRAMASNRGDRYATAAEFSSAIARLRDSLPDAGMAMNQTQPLTQPPPGLAPPAQTRPATQGSPRPAPALTPGVFTSKSTPAPAPSTPKLGLIAAAGGVLILGVGGALFLRRPVAEPPAAEPTVQAMPSTPSAPSAAPAASPAVVVLEMPSSAPTPVTPPATSASARPTRAQPAASVPRSRASAYGLSEDNPFK